MKQVRCKRAVAILSALIMGIMLMTSVSMTVKADSLSETVKQMGKNAWYRELIAEQSGFNNHSNFKFNLVDVDVDGVEDLIMTYTRTDNNTTGVWVWSYNKYITGVGGFTDEVNTINYCTETQYVQCIVEQTYGYTMSFGKLSSSVNDYFSYDIDFDGNYVIVDENTDEVAVITDEETIAEYNLWKDTYMPNPVEAYGKYEATEENLDTYLPLNIEVETETITLKVGEAFGISTENIDKLLEEAGYDYKSASPKIFYDEAVEMDGVYIVPASGVGVVEATGGKTLELLYVTDAEFGELFEQWQNGTLDEKYGTEVLLVDEAEGYCYYARAEKNGSTTITIPEYPLASGETITVNIPVFVEAVSQEGGNDSVIESTTDNSIVIDNSNGVLPVGTVLQSAKLESGDVYNNAEKIIKENVDTLVKYAVYELDLTDGNGAEINQLNGKVSVTMNVPFTMSKNTVLKVYRVENDTLVNCPATVSNGKVTFETDHFSTYIFAEEAAAVTVPNTGDTSQVITFVLLMMAGVLLCGVAVFGKKSRMTV